MSFLSGSTIEWLIHNILLIYVVSWAALGSLLSIGYFIKSDLLNSAVLVPWGTVYRIINI